MENHELTNRYYYGSDRLLVAVDCIILGFDTREEKLKLLLFEREVEPFKGQWSLIGSFVRKEERLEDAARRVLHELTGLKDVFLEQHRAYGRLERDPGDRVISISFWSLIRKDEPDVRLIEGHNARWFSVDALPELVLDHHQMVEDVLEHLRRQARHRPIGFELLPGKFTLPSLLKLYQEIYRKPLDDRNFRKKILATGLLKKLDTKDKSTSKKGAYQYRFDKKMYRELLEKGFDIEFK